LVKIKSSINNGLSDKLKNSFPNTIPTSRPEIHTDYLDLQKVKDILVASGVEIYKSKSTKLKYSVNLKFILTQNSRDHFLLSNLVNYLGCGNIKEDRKNNITYFYVSNLDSINSIILPFFKKYSLQGVKRLDFDDFYKVAFLINEKKHLTTNGFELIKNIKNGMNRSRTH
ncbi:homing endonuclease, partial [Tuber brumale]